MRSRNTVAYLGSFENLGTESYSDCEQVYHYSTAGVTYACHELEDTSLSLVEKNSYFVKTCEHLVVFSNRTRHASCKGIAKIVVNVQFARRAGCEEGIVETYCDVS